MSKKKDLDAILATRIEALWNVTRPTDKQPSEYIYREMARWYSREFNYKLHEVDDVPIETIALHYYESHYGNMTPEERDEEIRKLTQTEEERQAERIADDDFLKNVALKEVEKAAKKAKPESAVKKVVEDIKKITEEVKEGVDRLKEELAKPEIDMKFVSPEEMEAMDDWSILGPAPSTGKGDKQS